MINDLLFTFFFRFVDEDVLHFPCRAGLTGLGLVAETDINRLVVPSAQVHAAGVEEGPTVSIRNRVVIEGMYLARCYSEA